MSEANSTPETDRWPTLEPETIRMLHAKPGEVSLFSCLVYDAMMKFAKAGGTQEELEEILAD